MFKRFTQLFHRTRKPKGVGCFASPKVYGPTPLARFFQEAN